MRAAGWSNRWSVPSRRVLRSNETSRMKILCRIVAFLCCGYVWLSVLGQYMAMPQSETLPSNVIALKNFRRTAHALLHLLVVQPHLRRHHELYRRTCLFSGQLESKRGLGLSRRHHLYDPLGSGIPVASCLRRTQRNHVLARPFVVDEPPVIQFLKRIGFFSRGRIIILLPTSLSKQARMKTITIRRRARGTVQITRRVPPV